MVVGCPQKATDSARAAGPTIYMAESKAGKQWSSSSGFLLHGSGRAVLTGAAESLRGTQSPEDRELRGYWHEA